MFRQQQFATARTAATLGRIVRAPAVAAVLFGCALATMSGSGARADPFGDAAASGWFQQIVSTYRGFVLPGISPAANETDAGEPERLETQCQSSDVAGITDGARKAKMYLGEHRANCPDPGSKISAAR